MAIFYKMCNANVAIELGDIGWQETQLHPGGGGGGCGGCGVGDGSGPLVHIPSMVQFLLNDVISTPPFKSLFSFSERRKESNFLIFDIMVNLLNY